MNDYELLYYIHQKCEKSFDYLVEKYHRYIYFIIKIFQKNYNFFGYDDNDLYNEAIILLYECTQSFRDDLDVKFGTYFIFCLKKRYLLLLRNLSNNKNKMHAYSMSLDTIPNHENMSYYDVIDNGQIGVSEQVNNQYLNQKALDILKEKFNDVEKSIIYYYLLGYSYKEIQVLTKENSKKIDNTIQKLKRT